jgi:SAM-dependent methyltransferase
MIFATKPADSQSFLSAKPNENDYTAIIEAGLHELFEKRATACPMCGARNLTREQTLRDLVQFKPGYFHMSRCLDCGHIFQNPRLNERGLEFYYRDFYSGAGQAAVQQHLSSMASEYRARAKMIPKHAVPRRWLDIGAGYGQFSQHAKAIWPETEFHVVDMSPSIHRAQEEGWATHAYPGRFLDVVSELNPFYDVVSMFHYLEHTTDPLAELRAAASVLETRGYLMIELPDPDSVGRHLLRRYWPSWLAPQHLHLIPPRNMEKYLHDLGFETLIWHRARAHQSTDALFATGNYLQAWCPPRGLPWDTLHAPVPLKRQLFVRFLWRPLRYALIGFDKLISFLRYLPRWSNTYRVLAQKRN